MTMTARAACLVAVLLTLSLGACQSTPSLPQTREALMAELASAYDVEGILAREQTEALAELHRDLEQVRAQMNGRLTPAQQEKFSAGIDRFVASARSGVDARTAASVWAQAYAAELTDDDLRRIVAFSRTPAGAAEIAANRRAGDSLRDYLRQDREKRFGPAQRQFYAEMKALTGQP
jgi:cytochrome c556